MAEPLSADLTTLENVKEWLGILETEADDTLLARLITAASQFIQTWIGRLIASQGYTEVRDGHGGRRLIFANYPVTAVASVKVDGVAIPAANGALAAGYRFTATFLSLTGYAFTRALGNVELAYTAGYAATPPELEQACIDLVALRYKERERIGQVSASLAGQTVTFSQKDVPDGVRTVLNAWKKVVPL